jgi:hypothetical protein
MVCQLLILDEDEGYRAEPRLRCLRYLGVDIALR